MNLDGKKIKSLKIGVFVSLILLMLCGLKENPDIVQQILLMHLY
ncbi:hypothetical protein QJR26_18565 (plasmid) [Clostridium baratii]